MSLYSEFDPLKNGERGEWAPLKYANRVASWQSWRKSAIIIGPIVVAHEGDVPSIENKIEFNCPSLLACGKIKRQSGLTEEHGPYSGLTIMHPLVYDEGLEAFADIIDDKQKPVTQLWVDDSNAHFIRSYKGTLPFVDIFDRRHQVPAELVTYTFKGQPVA